MTALPRSFTVINVGEIRVAAIAWGVQIYEQNSLDRDKYTGV